MQLYLRAGFSLPTQGSFLLIRQGDNTSMGYYPRIMPSPAYIIKNWFFAPENNVWAVWRCLVFNPTFKNVYISDFFFLVALVPKFWGLEKKVIQYCGIKSELGDLWKYYC